MQFKLITLIISIFFTASSHATIITKSISFPSLNGLHIFNDETRTAPVPFDLGTRFSSITSASISLTAFSNKPPEVGVCIDLLDPFSCAANRRLPVLARYSFGSENSSSSTVSGDLGVNTGAEKTTSTILSDTNIFLDGQGTFSLAYSGTANLADGEVLFNTPNFVVSDITLTIEGDVASTAPPSKNCSLDTDGNASIDALTDGMLFIRYLFGSRGDSLTVDAVATDCVQCSAAELEPILEQCATASTSDIDGNGELDALTDGLLIIRYLFGIRGDALIENSVADNCNRCTQLEIETYLQGLIPLDKSSIGNSRRFNF
jgi:hypothetical protein